MVDAGGNHVRHRERTHLCSRLLQPRDEIIAVLFLLETGERHFRTRDVLFRVLKVFKEGFLIPNDAFVDISSGVREPFGGTALAAKKAMQVRSDLVGFACTDGVALSTTGLEETSALGSVTGSVRHFESLGDREGKEKKY